MRKIMIPIAAAAMLEAVRENYAEFLQLFPKLIQLIHPFKHCCTVGTSSCHSCSYRNIFTYIDLGPKALTMTQRPIVNLIVEDSEVPALNILQELQSLAPETEAYRQKQLPEHAFFHQSKGHRSFPSLQPHQFEKHFQE